MTKLQPGDPFEIEYGRGNRLTVRALSLSSKRRLIRLLEEITQASKAVKSDGPGAVLALFDKFEEGLRICSPKITDADLDRMDEDSAFDVINKTIWGQQLSEDERKKSESPQLSAAANCAANAPEHAAAS